MTEYRKEDLDSITDADRYKLVYELGVTFDRLDTGEHDAKVRADAIDDFVKLYKSKTWMEHTLVDEIAEQLKEEHNE